NRPPAARELVIRQRLAIGALVESQQLSERPLAAPVDAAATTARLDDLGTETLGSLVREPDEFCELRIEFETETALGGSAQTVDVNGQVVPDMEIVGHAVGFVEVVKAGETLQQPHRIVHRFSDLGRPVVPALAVVRRVDIVMLTAAPRFLTRPRAAGLFGTALVGQFVHVERE